MPSTSARSVAPRRVPAADEDVPGAPPAAPARRRGGLLRSLVAASSTVPLRTQVAVGAALHALVLVVLVAAAVTGSSSGVHHRDFFAGEDARLLAGFPRAIRSDEYFVTTPLIISQLEQGLPRFSGVYPGGMDMSILWDLPYTDWSMLFRPHSWGFFVLPLDHAYALRWWLPALALSLVTYCLLVTLWRRPVAALALAGAFVFSPFFQWWFGAGTFWPATLSIGMVLATVWTTDASRPGLRWAAGAGLAYLGLVAALSLYPAYLVPAALAGLAGSVGWLASGPVHLRVRERLRRAAPLLAGVVAAGALLLVYLSDRRQALDAITSTLYPGERSWPTGESASFPLSLYGGVFAQGFRSDELGGFAPNASEGAGFLLVGLYLLPVVAWLVVDRRRRGGGLDWALLAPVACLLVLLAFVYVPGWDGVAALLLLTSTTTPRIVIGVGLLSMLLLALVVHRILQRPGGPVLWPAVGALAVAALSHVAVLDTLGSSAPQVRDATWWPVLVPLLVLAVLLFGLGRATLPAVLTLVVSFAVCGWVNPVYRGVLDLRETDLARAIEAEEAADPGAWVTTAGTEAVAVLRETAVLSYAGTQGWPPEEMWRDLDPEGDDARVWNRYAHVFWSQEPGAAPLSNPYVDTVVVALDSCGAVVQAHVDHVVTDAPLEQACVELETTVQEEGGTYYVYDVVEAPAA